MDALKQVPSISKHIIWSGLFDVGSRCDVDILSHRVFLYVYAECEPGAKVSLHEYVTWYQCTGVLCYSGKRVDMCCTEKLV